MIRPSRHGRTEAMVSHRSTRPGLRPQPEPILAPRRQERQEEMDNGIGIMGAAQGLATIPVFQTSDAPRPAPASYGLRITSLPPGFPRKMDRVPLIPPEVPDAVPFLLAFSPGHLPFDPDPSCTPYRGRTHHLTNRGFSTEPYMDDPANSPPNQW
jgi:hypothetical protein